VISLDELESRLSRGLHVENLHVTLEISQGLAKASLNPLALYVVASVLGDLLLRWDGRVVQASEAQTAERELLPLLQAAARLARDDTAEQDVLETLNRLVTAFIDLQDRGELGRKSARVFALRFAPTPREEPQRQALEAETPAVAGVASSGRSRTRTWDLFLIREAQV
jgi:hypothetical protein